MTTQTSLFDVFQVIDPRFRALVNTMAPLERIATGYTWTEGPVWFGDHQMLLFSEIPSNRVLRWQPGLGVSTFRAPADFTNGNTRDRQGRLISCHHGTRSVTRTEPDGARTVLADRHKGRRLNSPNDVVVKSDGSIWFTDPSYGIISNLEGYRAPQEQDGHFVYRLNPETGELAAVITDFTQPNGLAFSPDESRLYVAESGSSHDPSCPAVIRAFDLDSAGHLSGGAALVTVDCGLPDGFRVDSAGNIWTSAGDGVQCFAPDGTLLGKILMPERASNLCFGGPRGHDLFITATSSVYRIFVDITGAPSAGAQPAGT